MLNIVLALSEEARPVIQRLRLKRMHAVKAFPVYGNDDIRLIVSGIGKLAAASATAYLAGIETANKATAWLNIGIAGSKDLQIGQSVIAHTVTDAESNRNFYPTIYFDNECLTAPVTTVSIPESEYSDDVVFDMEAAGFYSAALRFSTTELIHCFKVISDNCSSDVEQLSKTDVLNLVEGRLEQIIQLSDELRAGALSLGLDENYQHAYQELSKIFHFSVSQQAQLATLVQRWFAITEASPSAGLDMERCNNAKSLLAQLQEKLDELPISYRTR